MTENFELMLEETCSASYDEEQMRQQLTESLLATKLQNLIKFRESTLGQTESDEELLDLLDATGLPKKGMGYHPLVTILVMYATPTEEKNRKSALLNPTLMGDEPVPNLIAAIRIATKEIKENSRVSWTNLLVGDLIKISTINGDTSTIFLYPTEVFELKRWFANYAQSCLPIVGVNGGQLSQSTPIISTVCTSANKRIKVADASGLESQEDMSSSEDSEFEKLVDFQSSDSETSETFCNTFVQMTESSKKLMADQKINDWVIDISIYKYVFECLLNYYRRRTYDRLDLRRPYLNYIKCGGSIKDKLLIIIRINRN